MVDEAIVFGVAGPLLSTRIHITMVRYANHSVILFNSVMLVNFTGLESAPYFEKLSPWGGEPRTTEWVLAWRSVQASVHPICCQHLIVMHILIRCCASRKENTLMLFFCIFFLFFFFFLPNYASPQQRVWGSGRKRFLPWLAQCRYTSGDHCPGDTRDGSCETLCHIMERGNEKGSTQASGGFALGYTGLMKTGSALEWAKIWDASSTFQLQETGELEQEFGQWTQEKYLTAKSVVFIVTAAVGELRPGSTQLNKT